MKIVYMGTPDFAAASLQALLDSRHEVCAVFTQPDKPVGRKAILTPPPVKVLDDSTEDRRRLRMLLAETAELRRTGDASQELLLIGSVYKICGYILREFADASESDGDLRAVANIDKALALIRDRFAEPITVDMAAAITGYGKSNFCRIFKHIVGETFHSALNRRRVENACCYLGETAMPVSDIAGLVGFADAKSFCRVFKSITGTSPGQYRTAQRHR